MIISLMHIHLAENVKLTSRRVDFWEAVLGFFALLGKSRHLSTIEFREVFNVLSWFVENVTILCLSCRNENCKSNSSTRPEKPGQCIIFFPPFSVKTPREAGRGDEKKTPESKSINNVTG